MRRFFIYGLTGIVMELLWTAFTALMNNDYSLQCHTSLLMFPIYGMAVLLEPLFLILKEHKVNIFLRSVLYAVLIFFVEYGTGGIYTLLGICPWNYLGAKFSINGLIRLDYAPLWAIAGIFFEYLSAKLNFTKIQ